MTETDFTAMRARQLLQADADEPADEHERLLREVQAKYPGACVYYDDELDDIVVDLSSGRRA